MGIYQDDKVTVTPKTVTIAGTVYQASTITSVKVDQDHTGCALAGAFYLFGIPSLLLSLIFGAAVLSDPTPIGFGVFLVPFLFGGILCMLGKGASSTVLYTLTLTTSGVERAALSHGDRQYLQTVADAITQTFAAEE